MRENGLHISLEKAKAFDPYIQVGAIWSDNSLSDEEAWIRYGEVLQYFKKQDGVRQIKSSDGLDGDLPGIILAVEGARLLCGDLDRLDVLYRDGVRILTLTWAGSDIIGGAHGTDDPLTVFGCSVVERCFDLGIIPDVSHASRKVTKQVLDMAKSSKKSVIASHSDSYSVFSHQRNLTDHEFSYIISLGGIVGVSLYPPHLAGKETAGIDDVMRHIMHYINLGGIGSVALGCDFDGIECTPTGLDDVSCLVKLWDALSQKIGEDGADRVFFGNAHDFLKTNL